MPKSDELGIFTQEKLTVQVQPAVNKRTRHRVARVNSSLLPRAQHAQRLVCQVTADGVAFEYRAAIHFQRWNLKKREEEEEEEREREKRISDKTTTTTTTKYKSVNEERREKRDVRTKVGG